MPHTTLQVLADADSSPLFAVPPEPFGVVAGPDGKIYFCDVSNHRIFSIDEHADLIEAAVGSGEEGNAGNGGAAINAALNQPYEIRFNQADDLFFVDMLGHVVRRVESASGTIYAVAGNGQEGFSGDGGAAAQAQLARPHSIEFDQTGRLYIADIANHRVRQVNLVSGLIETFAGTGEQLETVVGKPLEGNPTFGPRAVAFEANGDMILGLREGNAIYRVSHGSQIVSHVAGNGKFGYDDTDADARLAKLSGPKGIALSADGSIIIADTESHTIRRIDADGVITTLAGNGEKGESLNPAGACLHRPHGVFVEAGGSILIGDSDNRRLLRLS